MQELSGSVQAKRWYQLSVSDELVEFGHVTRHHSAFDAVTVQMTEVGVQLCSQPKNHSGVHDGT